MPDDTGGRPAENTDRPPTGDGSWGAPDRSASERAEHAGRGGSAESGRSARPGDDATVAPGWEQQPIASYEAADSGGWGGPGATALTGPVPRIRRDHDNRDDRDVHGEHDVRGDEPAGAERRGLPEPQASGPEPSDSDAVATTTFAAPQHAGERRAPHDTGPAGDATGAPAHHDNHARNVDAADENADESDDEWRRYSAAQAAAPPSTFGARSERAPGFARRVTASLAPIAFWLIVGYLIVDFVAGVYALGSVAALGPSPDLGLVIVTVVAGLLKVVALAALARLGLEACLNLAELTGRHRGNGR